MKFILLSYAIFHLAVTGRGQDKTTVTRNLKASEKEIEVTIIIEKPSARGLASLTESFPKNASIRHLDCKPAIHRIQGEKLYIVWDDIPSDTRIEISYSIVLSKPVADTTGSMKGEFTAEFLPADLHFIKIETGDFERWKNKQENDALASTDKTEKKRRHASASEEHPIAQPDGIYYCIQVAASKKNVKSDYLEKTYGFDGEFETHDDGDWFRITVGKFRTRAEADIALADYKSRYFTQCFLSAYQNGTKITPQQADELLK